MQRLLIIFLTITCIVITACKNTADRKEVKEAIQLADKILVETDSLNKAGIFGSLENATPFLKSLQSNDKVLQAGVGITGNHTAGYTYELKRGWMQREYDSRLLDTFAFQNDHLRALNDKFLVSVEEIQTSIPDAKPFQAVRIALAQADGKRLPFEILIHSVF